MSDEPSNDPGGYCLACAAMLDMLGGKTTVVFKLPCAVRFEPRSSRVVRTAIWREGDHIELMHWTRREETQEPRHMIVQNMNRRRQYLVRLCEQPLRAAVEKLHEGTRDRG